MIRRRWSARSFAQIEALVPEPCEPEADEQLARRPGWPRCSCVYPSACWKALGTGVLQRRGGDRGGGGDDPGAGLRRLAGTISVHLGLAEGRPRQPRLDRTSSAAVARKAVGPEE